MVWKRVENAWARVHSLFASLTGSDFAFARCIFGIEVKSQREWVFYTGVSAFREFSERRASIPSIQASSLLRGIHGHLQINNVIFGNVSGVRKASENVVMSVCAQNNNPSQRNISLKIRRWPLPALSFSKIESHSGQAYEWGVHSAFNGGVEVGMRWDGHVTATWKRNIEEQPTRVKQTLPLRFTSQGLFLWFFESVTKSSPHGPNNANNGIIV